MADRQERYSKDSIGFCCYAWHEPNHTRIATLYFDPSRYSSEFWQNVLLQANRQGEQPFWLSSSSLTWKSSTGRCRRASNTTERSSRPASWCGDPNHAWELEGGRHGSRGAVHRVRHSHSCGGDRNPIDVPYSVL